MKAVFGWVLATLAMFGLGTTTSVRTTPPASVPSTSIVQQARPAGIATSPTSVPQTVINWPVIERITSTPTAPGVSQSSLSAQLQSLEDDLLGRIASVVVPPVATPTFAPVTSQVLALSQHIDALTGTAITNPNITGGTITGADITAHSFSFSGVLSIASALFDSLTATRLTATNATTTNATSTNLYAGNLALGSALAVSSGGTGGTSTSAARAGLGLAYASSADIANNQNIATWGDSLTAGTGGTPFPTQLAALSGYTVYNGGVGGDTSTQIATRMLGDTAKHSWPTIIWAGRNNYSDPTTVKADIAAMVASLNSQNYIVLSVLNGSYGGYEIPGGAGYAYITQLNSDLASTYGSHFLDVRSYLVSLYNPSIPQDVTDHSNDTPPSSLRSDATRQRCHCDGESSDGGGRKS